MWFDNEFNAGLADSFGELVELFFRHGQSGVGDGHFVSVDGVGVVDAPVIVPYPVTNNLVSVEGIILPTRRGPSLLTTQNIPVKLLGQFQIMNRKGIMKGYRSNNSLAGSLNTKHHLQEQQCSEYSREPGAGSASFVKAVAVEADRSVSPPPRRAATDDLDNHGLERS